MAERNFSSSRIQGVPPPRPIVPIHRIISLTKPRPDGERLDNEYIDTPLRPRVEVPKPPRLKSGRYEGNRVPITSQPGLLKKEKAEVLSDTSSDTSSTDGHNDSIICAQCGKCKCSECQMPRQLPSKWICNNKCLCSAQNIIDNVTCICCARALFYHWRKDSEEASGISCSDQPCSCAPTMRLQRWLCLGVSSLVLPCLCLYPPLKLSVKLCEKTFSSLNHNGCKCAQKRTTIITQQPERGLLDFPSDC